MNIKWESTHSENTCPSCLALHGQVHSREAWGELKPGHHRLYCKEHCNCKLTETDELETGDIAAAPLRQLSEPIAALFHGSPAGLRPALSMETHSPDPLKENTMNQFTIQLKATPTDDGFDILAISAGEAKGHNITFSRDVLMSSMPLYDGIPVFVDHAGLFNPNSVRDLAGTLHEPTWNEAEQGIQLKLIPGGPAKQVLLDVRDDARKNPAIMKAVGFSSVVNVQLNKQRAVTKIVNVRSTDVVIDPARGGKFLSAFNGHMKGDKTMADQTNTEQAEFTAQQTAALELQGANEIIRDLQEKQKQATELQVAQCRALLDTSLAASKLPAASQKAVRKPFEVMLESGRPFLPTELQAAITDKREELAALNEGASIQGPSRDGGNQWSMFNSRDQIEAAVYDLFGVDRPDALKNARIASLSGIREAYILMTGDSNFMGGYYPEFALVTANFPGVVANVMNKMLIKAWADFEQHYGWWRKITTIEHFTNLNTVSWIRTGTIGSLPTVAEQGEYTELPIGDNKETSSWTKYGGYIPLTIEAVLRDDLRAFKRLPREAAMGGIRNISEQIAAVFTSNSAAGPTLADTGALFNATAVTTAGGHANLLTTALGTDYTAWNAVAKAVYNQPLQVKNATGYYGTGKKQAIDPSFVLVPRDLKNQAEALFVPRWEATAQNVAAVSPSWGGRVEVLTVPEWTDATDWAAAVDPNLVPCIMLGEIFGEKPQIFSASSEIDPAMFANDESRIKVRQFLTVGVADFRGLHKSNV